MIEGNSFSAADITSVKHKDWIVFRIRNQPPVIMELWEIKRQLEGIETAIGWHALGALQDSRNRSSVELERFCTFGGDRKVTNVVYRIIAQGDVTNAKTNLTATDTLELLEFIRAENDHPE